MKFSTMHKKIVGCLALLAAALFFSSCKEVVGSVNSLRTAKNQFFDPKLLGTWEGQKVENNYNVEKGENDSYVFTMRDEKGIVKEKLVGSLVRIGDYDFLEVAMIPQKGEQEKGFVDGKEISGMYVTVRFTKKDDIVTLWGFDDADKTDSIKFVAVKRADGTETNTQVTVMEGKALEDFYKTNGEHMTKEALSFKVIPKQ